MPEDSHNTNETPGIESTPDTSQTAVIGKGYSYLFASMLTLFVTLQSFNFSVDNSEEKLQVKLSIKEVPIHVFIPSISVIAAILGLNTDAIALSIGKFLSQNQENK
jgi:hypothetical protein